jgi:hypothetical protein
MSSLESRDSDARGTRKGEQWQDDGCRREIRKSTKWSHVSVCMYVDGLRKFFLTQTTKRTRSAVHGDMGQCSIDASMWYVHGVYTAL